MDVCKYCSVINNKDNVYRVRTLHFLPPGLHSQVLVVSLCVLLHSFTGEMCSTVRFHILTYRSKVCLVSFTWLQWLLVAMNEHIPAQCG